MMTTRARTPARHAARRLTLGTATLLLLAGFAASAAPLAAQAPPRQPQQGWRSMRVAKWSLLAVSAGLGYYAWQQNRIADARYADLQNACVRAPEQCQLTTRHYDDPALEDLYRQTNHHDAVAQRGMLFGEAALLGSATFFILDLRHGQKPEDIPYDPTRRSRGAGHALRVGVRWHF
jgi:hypothetical protein